jgi:DNA-binding NarL/FixJ family response regulator
MTINLMLASSNENRLASWKQGLDGFVITSLMLDRLDKLSNDVVRIKPEVLLLDFDLLRAQKLNGLNDAANLRKLCTETKIIILGGDLTEDMEWELLKAGVRGCCRNDIKLAFLKQVVMAVRQGELWIRRSLTGRVIDELGKITSKNKAYRASHDLLNKLTQREYDIAMRVGSGESNKQIAQSCAITERTVKAHLTEIYLKLGITDRLNLALVLSASDKAGLINPAPRQ